MEPRIKWYDELGSTNDVAIQALQSGCRTPCWVVARRQTAGRGQYGRKWWSGEGALLTSGAFRLVDYAIPPESSGQIALLAGVATLETVHFFLHENRTASNHTISSTIPTDTISTETIPTISDYLSTIPSLGLHWPNDLFYQGKKLAGILVESPHPGELVVGIGINVNNTMRNAPPEVRERSTTLRDSGFLSIDLPSMLSELVQSFEHWLYRFSRNPDELIQTFNRYCLQRNRVVQLYSSPSVSESLHREGTVDSSTPVQGICRGVDPEGRLLVEIQGEIRSFVSVTVRIV